MHSNTELTFFSSYQNSYKKFDDYVDITPLGNDDFSGHQKFIAREKKVTCVNDSLYEERCFLLMREGLFRAQIEKAMADIYQYFMGYSTNINIVKKENDYYVSSQSIKNFKTWEDHLLSGLISQDENTYELFLNYANEKLKIINLGKMCVLTQFFADTDAHGGNFGLQIFENQCRAFKIDNEKAFSFEHQAESNSGNDFQSDLQTDLKHDITKTDWFNNEKLEMKQKIVNTDFSVIENILRKNITSNQLESTYWLLTHMLKYAVNMSSEDSIELLNNLKLLEKADPAQYGVDAIIQTLRLRHEALKIEISNEPRQFSSFNRH